MRKVIKIGFPIVCFVVIGGTFFLLNRAVDKVNNDKKVNAESQVVSNKIEDGKETEETKKEMSFSISEDVLNAQKKEEDERKERAIEIVKNKDGTRENVYYSNDGKDGNNYIVSIKDQESARTIIQYSVNLDMETIVIYGN